MIDIYADFWRSIQAFQPKHADQLCRLGFDPVTIEKIGGIGIDLVRVEGSIWEPVEQGDPAIVVPVWDGPAFDIRVPRFRPSPLIDLVAWRPKDPDALPTRLNSAVAINAFAVYPALAGDEAIKIYRTPATWQGDPDGIVIIDWSGCDALLGKRQVIAEDVEHGEMVRKRLRQLRDRITPKIPPIGILASRMAA